MVARVWTGVAQPGEAAKHYLAHLRDAVMPNLERLQGYQGIQVLRRPHPDGDQFMVITFWHSVDAIRTFAGLDVESAVVALEARRLLASFADRATHYEVAESRAPLGSAGR